VQEERYKQEEIKKNDNIKSNLPGKQMKVSPTPSNPISRCRTIRPTHHRIAFVSHNIGSCMSVHFLCLLIYPVIIIYSNWIISSKAIREPMAKRSQGSKPEDLMTHRASSMTTVEIMPSLRKQEVGFEERLGWFRTARRCHSRCTCTGHDRRVPQPSSSCRSARKHGYVLVAHQGDIDRC